MAKRVRFEVNKEDQSMEETSTTISEEIKELEDQFC